MRKIAAMPNPMRLNIRIGTQRGETLTCWGTGGVYRLEGGWVFDAVEVARGLPPPRGVARPPDFFGLAIRARVAST